VVWLF